MLIGIQPDLIYIYHNEDIIKTKNAIIGIYDKKISKNYSALIGLELLEGGKRNENNRYYKQSIQ